MSDGPLTNAKATAAALGIHPSQLSRLMHDGAVTPEIREGRMVRFDVEKVRKQLRKRAIQNLKTDAIPDGMVPVY